MKARHIGGIYSRSIRPDQIPAWPEWLIDSYSAYTIYDAQCYRITAERELTRLTGVAYGDNVWEVLGQTGLPRRQVRRHFPEVLMEVLL